MIEIPENIDETQFSHEFIRRLIAYRIRNKKNCFLAIVGGSGEGKSYTALKIAEIVQPDFNVREQIIYHPTHFIEAVENSQQKGYRVLILDEAHTTVNARQWYSFVNLCVSYVISTFRQIRSMCIIIVTPSINWIEKTVREMVNLYGIVIRPTDREVYLRLYEINMDYYELKDQMPYIRRITLAQGENIYKLHRLVLSLPSQHIIDEYEKYAVEYKKNLIKRSLQALTRRMSADSEATEKTLDEIVDLVMNNPRIMKTLLKKTKAGEGIKLKRAIVKSLFKLTDMETFDLEEKLEKKMREAGWL